MKLLKSWFFAAMPSSTASSSCSPCPAGSRSGCLERMACGTVPSMNSSSELAPSGASIAFNSFSSGPM
jgi:hypothetical protein